MRIMSLKKCSGMTESVVGFLDFPSTTPGSGIVVYGFFMQEKKLEWSTPVTDVCASGLSSFLEKDINKSHFYKRNNINKI